MREESDESTLCTVHRDYLAAVNAVGFEAFGDSVVSDHRGAFVDIDLVTLLRGPAVDLAPMAFRELNNKNPKMVEKYRSKVLNRVVELLLVQRWVELYNVVPRR